jgi:hypothetical protein
MILDKQKAFRGELWHRNKIYFVTYNFLIEDQSLEYSAMASVRLQDFIARYSPAESVSL